MRRLGGILALLLLGLAAAGGVAHLLLWDRLADRLEAGFESWAAGRRAQGWTVSHGPPERGGWPFAATLALPGFRLAGGEGGLGWESGRLTLRLAPPRLDTLHLEAEGPQRLRLGTLDLPFSAEALLGRVPVRGTAPPASGSLDARGLRLDAPGGAATVEALLFNIEAWATAIEGEPALSVSGSLSGLELPLAAPLGRRVERAALDASLTGPVPPGGEPAARAAAWRDAGGAVELRRLEARWGPAEAGLAATLALDDALQPMGAGTLRLDDPAALLDALAAAGLLAERDAELARRVAGLLARPPPEGGPPRLEVPLTLEDGRVSLARLPVARLPPLPWPARREAAGGR